MILFSKRMDISPYMELSDPLKMLKQRDANKIALILIQIQQQPWEIPISGTKLRNPWKRTPTCYILYFVCCLFSFTEAIINQEHISEGHFHLLYVYSNSINCTWFNVQLPEVLNDRPSSAIFPLPLLHICVAFMFYTTYWTLLYYLFLYHIFYSS